MTSFSDILFIALFIGLKVEQGGLIKKDKELTIFPFSTIANPTEHALYSCSVAVSKSMVVKFIAFHSSM
jgi:hypothetical protein